MLLRIKWKADCPKLALVGESWGWQGGEGQASIHVPGRFDFPFGEHSFPFNPSATIRLASNVILFLDLTL